MYLLACEKTHEAIAIDPLDHALCLKIANDMGWKIKIVANTHHHHDHIGGNDPVISATSAELVAHSEAMETIPNVDRGLNAGDKLVCGNLTLKIMDTPGHTMSHICLYFEGNDTNKPALFCGDTLFNAGVGRCDFGGDPIIMHQTFEEQIFLLSVKFVRLYICQTTKLQLSNGTKHRYRSSNSRFSLIRPDYYMILSV